MDLTVIASTIATLIFTEASKEGGKFLGKAVSKQISELKNAVRKKFKQAKIEGMLEQAEKEPTELNINGFKYQLENQMKGDEDFAQKLLEFLEEVKSQGGEQVQIILEGVEAQGNITAEGIKQKSNSKDSTQTIGKDIKAGNDVTFKDIEQS